LPHPSKRIQNKNDKSKWKEVGFGGKVLTDEKSARFFLDSFLIQPIILFLFVLIFLLSGKCCGGKISLSVLSIPRQKLRKVL
jgi:hypothetical protein